jgi:hypothetical protein
VGVGFAEGVGDGVAGVGFGVGDGVDTTTPATGGFAGNEGVLGVKSEDANVKETIRTVAVIRTVIGAV